MGSFVSRGGEKLQAALEAFNINSDGLIAADFGASTGGFTDCLLQNGVLRVYAVDTSYGELHWKLRNDPRVVVKERTNAMHVILPEKVDIIVIDTGWTRQEKIIPNALKNLKKNGLIITLIKPHYEANPSLIRKGRLSDESVEQVLSAVKLNVEMLGICVSKIIESPITGGRAGNREFLALLA